MREWLFYSNEHGIFRPKSVVRGDELIKLVGVDKVKTSTLRVRIDRQQINKDNLEEYKLMVAISPSFDDRPDRLKISMRMAKVVGLKDGLDELRRCKTISY